MRNLLYGAGEFGHGFIGLSNYLVDLFHDIVGLDGIIRILFGQ